jgi:hypothetical protein
MIYNWNDISLKNLTGERWVPIPDSRYLCSNKGRVKSLNKDRRSPPEKILRQQKSNGYLWVRLYFVNSSSHFYVHRLVAELFLDKIPGKEYVNHKNTIKTDNDSGNLEWCTQKENIDHSVENGLNGLKGDKNPVSRFSNSQVIEIYKSAKSANGLAKEYGVHKSTIRYIKNGKNWSSVTGAKKKNK